MPLIRKVIQIGEAKAVTLPRDWLKYVEETSGKKVTEVLVEVNDKIVIKPKM